MNTMNMWVASSASGHEKNASGRSMSEREKTNSFAKYFLSNSMNETDYCITIIPQSTECPFIFFSPHSNLWIQFVIQNVYESVQYSPSFDLAAEKHSVTAAGLP